MPSYDPKAQKLHASRAREIRELATTIIGSIKEARNASEMESAIYQLRLARNEVGKLLGMVVVEQAKATNREEEAAAKL